MQECVFRYIWDVASGYMAGRSYDPTLPALMEGMADSQQPISLWSPATSVEPSVCYFLLQHGGSYQHVASSWKDNPRSYARQYHPSGIRQESHFIDGNCLRDVVLFLYNIPEGLSCYIRFSILVII